MLHRGGTFSSLIANIGLMRLESRGFKGLPYADGVFILVSGKFFAEGGGTDGASVGILLSWNESCGLRVNPNTIDVMLARNYIETFRLPMLGGREIPLPSEFKHLNVVSTNKVNCKRNTIWDPPTKQFAGYSWRFLDQLLLMVVLVCLFQWKILNKVLRIE